MQGSWFSAIVVFGLASGFSGGAAGAAELPEADLREMEQLLAQLNFDPGAIDGEVDDRTRTAIRLYQEFAVLPVDGAPSANLLRELRQVSQVYAEMREAAPPADEAADEVAAETEPDSTPPSTPEPEIAETVEPDIATPAAAPAVEALPQAAPEAPPAMETATEPMIADAGAAEPEPEPDAAEAVEPPLEPAPEVAAPEVAEPDPESAKETPPEAAPEPKVAEPTEPASDSDVADASAPPAEPEPEPEVAEAVEPQAEAAPKTAPEAASEAAEPPAAPEAEVGFNLTGMIARLKQRDDAAASAVSAQTARAEPAAPVATTDRAGYERTLIWKVQQELKRIGLDPGAADGNMRARTRDAIETYQRARGLRADGRVTEELFARLKVEAPPPAPGTPQPQGDAAPLGSVAPQAAGIDAAPSNGYQAFSAGYGVAQAGDYGAAVKLYDQAIDGGDLALEHLAAALYNRANAYQYLGVLDKAIEDYSAAIANKPGFPAAYYNRGFAFDMKGEKSRAVEDFRRARDLGLQRLGVRSPDLPPPLL